MLLLSPHPRPLLGHHLGTLKVHILTVVGPSDNTGGLALRGLFVGDDEECFKAAVKLSLEVNLTVVPQPIEKVQLAKTPPTTRVG